MAPSLLFQAFSTPMENAFPHTPTSQFLSLDGSSVPQGAELPFVFSRSGRA